MLRFCVVLFCAGIAAGLQCWTCDNVFSHQDCLDQGRLVTCDDSQNTCQIELRHGGWGNNPLIKKSCKQLTACGSNHMQDLGSASVTNLDTQCNMKPPSSVCRCCCNTDGCNHYVMTCDELGGRGGGSCKKLSAPRNGRMKCTGGNGPLSSCVFTCKRGHMMIGAAVSTCDYFSKRDNPAPICEPIKCEYPVVPQNGSVTCTRGRAVGSRCRYNCDEGYKLVGATDMSCTEETMGGTYGLWSRMPPICQPKQCPLQNLRNGRIDCSNSNFVGSTCALTCNDELGYQVYPPTTQALSCQSNEEWDKAMPCCSLPCPPFAVMDFIVVLDSSSSVGRSNWNKMKAFVRSFIGDFSIRNDATHVSVVRYNRHVDTSTQILLDDYPNSLADLLAAFDRIPYNGSGTRTGQALNYTASTLIPTGNRPNARDVVLLITDGASQDDVVVPSHNLHATGALVFVLPVQPPRVRLRMSEIYTIAGNRANVITDALEGGFAALDEEFAGRISQLLCASPCPLN
ncbi:uncharacterized protein LOC100186994 [Ciona intestinalis]